MAFIAGELSLEVIGALRPVVPKIKAGHKDLADQLMRAANSVALNLGEAELSDPGNRRARLFSAAASAKESLTALRIAGEWGFVTAEQVEPAAGLLRRIIAILWKMTRG